MGAVREATSASTYVSTATERAAAQEHFIDLCRMLGIPTPNEADPTVVDDLIANRQNKKA